MIEAVRELSRLLASPEAGTDDLAAYLGAGGEDLGGTVVVAEPSLDGVARAGVVREATGGAPALVTLELAEPQPLDPLQAAFGEPRPIYPDHPGEPVLLLYDVDVGDAPFAVALLATDDGRKLTLRRDVRLG